MIVFRFPALDVSGDDAEIAIADIEDKSGGAVGRPRTDETTGSIESFEAVIAGTRFPTDCNDFAIG